MICHLIPLALGGAGGCARKVWLRSSNLFDPGRERWPRQHPHTHQDSQPRPQTSLSPVRSRDTPQTRNGMGPQSAMGRPVSTRGFPMTCPLLTRVPALPGGDVEFHPQPTGRGGSGGEGETCSSSPSTKSCSAVGYWGVPAPSPAQLWVIRAFSLVHPLDSELSMPGKHPSTHWLSVLGFVGLSFLI